MMRIFVLVTWLLSLTACINVPVNLSPVKDFDLERYSGTWYELARLDHDFETGLSHVQAHYTLNDDNTVTVINRGWNEQEQQWKEAVGVAKSVKHPDLGHLKVSFWGPFYSSYVVFYLEPDYSVALVSGYNLDYFWILSRSTSLPAYKFRKYLRIAQQAGIDTSALIFPFSEVK